jgi:hypothetical protein
VAVEFLRARIGSHTSEFILNSMFNAVRDSGDEVFRSTVPTGADWMVLFGVGNPINAKLRDQQVKAGKRALCWDLGYIQRRKLTGYARCSIDSDHPQQWLDRTAPDPSRFDRLNVSLRNDYKKSGQIVLVGLGRKSRVTLGDWETKKFAELKRRFPGKRIVFRPKKGDGPRLDCEKDTTSPIEEVIKGASLVVCRHSNVAIDACLAGIPFEAEDGAAAWMTGKDYTVENRLDFLRRLAWWQWKPDEMSDAWKFLKGIV